MPNALPLIETTCGPARSNVQALRKLGTEVEFHRYRNLAYGFGPGVGTSAEGWLDNAVRFWKKTIGPHDRNLK